MPRAPINNLDALLAQPHHILFETLSGSRAYGTAHAESDEDIRGIYALPQSSYLGLVQPTTHVNDARNDTVYYSLRRFLELAASANPTILEILYTPQDCIRTQRDCIKPLFEARGDFVTREALGTHIGYAQSQVKKARGRNKWVNNPQATSPPTKETFCWFIPRTERPMPYRPIPLRQSGIELAECHIASLEHVAHTYRLYHYGPGAKGVFRKGTLTCEAIPVDDEDPRCIGLLVYARVAYEKALQDHKHYWEWHANRNRARWHDQEAGELDYDAKNMMHTFRLLLSGAHILEEGCPLIRFSGKQLAFLKSILAGTFSYEELLQQAEAKIAELQAGAPRCPLPERSDAAQAERLLREITDVWKNLHES